MPAVSKDGIVSLRIIKDGWGSSGFYSPDVLKRDGPKVFTENTKMYWNHATLEEEAVRPEGDLNNLAAVLVSDARWEENGKAGPGLYADAKVFETYRQSVDDLARYIGVSIRANGKASQGEVAGRKGPIIQEISTAKSIDWVTTPGAGGQIVSLFEAARNNKQSNEATPVAGQVQAPTGQGVNKMADKAREVNMADLGDVEKKLEEANRKLEAFGNLTTRLEETERRINKTETDNARLREAMLLRDAKDFVARELEGKQLPEPTRKRLLESLTIDPPIVDGALDITTYAMKVREAVKTETDYLASVAGYGSGNITGMGGAAVSQNDSKKTQERLTEAFAGLGLTEQEIKWAARAH